MERMVECLYGLLMIHLPWIAAILTLHVIIHWLLALHFPDDYSYLPFEDESCCPQKSED